MHRRLLSHSIQNAVVAIALLAEFIALVGHPLFGWGTKVFAATPRPLVYRAPAPPSARAVLLGLGAAAARQPGLPGIARTPYAYVKREGWHLAAQVPGQTVSSRVLPTSTESWLKPDGSGRILTITSTVNGSRIDDEAIPAGEPLLPLSRAKAVQARRLALADVGSAASGGQFAAIINLADRQQIPPAVQAAILRLLARIPGLINAGTVTDRDGRPAVAVSLDSAYTGVMVSYTLILDQGTGRLLEADQTLIGDPNKLDVQQGSILAYTTFLASGDVANTTTRP